MYFPKERTIALTERLFSELLPPEYDVLNAFCAAGPDLTGFIISEISVSEPLLLPQQGKLSDRFYLRRIARRTRREMLSDSPSALFGQ